MGYEVEFVDAVLEYLAAIEGLQEEDRAAVLAGTTEELSRDADHFLFIVSAHFLEMGVVRVVYVEHTTHPLPS